MSLSLEKRKQLDLNKAIVQVLAKSRGLEGQVAEVKIGMDISGSMRGLYDNGTVQATFERLTPLAMQFDDNQTMDVILFGARTHKAADLTLANLEGYVRNEITAKYGLESDTKYAGVIRQVINDYGEFETIRTPRQVQVPIPRQTREVKSGFLGLSKKTEFIGEQEYRTETVYDEKRVPKTGGLKNPVFLILITDGNNSDPRETEAAIREASRMGIFIHCVGIGNATFSFLEKLDDLDGRLIDNVSFDPIENLNNLSDSQLYEMLLKEFPGWVKMAKDNHLILN